MLRSWKRRLEENEQGYKDTVQKRNETEERDGERKRGRERERERERKRGEVTEVVELMHAPGHAPKPLTVSQPTSLYDKYKRRAQRLLLIAWQKLRNPHFVLRTPNSYQPSFLQPSNHPPLVLLLSHTPLSLPLPPPLT